MPLNDTDLTQQIRRHATRHEAPEALRLQVQAQWRAAHPDPDPDPDASATGAPGTPAGVARARRWRSGWLTASAGFALGAVCAVLAGPMLTRMNLAEPPDADLVDDHVHALQLGAIAQVASTDHHTVKPWFQGRLDYAPPVIDLTDDGYALAGGRIEHLRGKAVATLAYTHNGHVIDLYVWPTDLTLAPVRSVRKGFEVLHWSDGSMQVWVVSDLERSELERFAQRWRQRRATP
jgi:anti-sigma factor RsiW